MFDLDIMAIVDQETSALANKLDAIQPVEAPLPALLYYAADAPTLSDLATHRALRAHYSTDPRLDSVLSYGFDLLRCFIQARVADTSDGAGDDTLRRQFRDAALRHLDPCNAVFAAFHVRFTERACPLPAIGQAPHRYAVGFESARMGVQVGGPGSGGCLSIGKAIYQRQEQLHLLSMLYGAFETYYVEAIGRFGKQHAPSCLGQCWGRLYQVLSTRLALFRPPAHADHREWLATALDVRPLEQRSNDNIDVELFEDTFVPYVRVRMPARAGRSGPGLPIREIVLPGAMPATHRRGLRAFLNLHGLATTGVRTDTGS